MSSPSRPRISVVEQPRDAAAPGALLLLGLSHQSAPLELRERLALPAHQSERLFSELSGELEVGEAAALFTCNRVELYLVVEEPEAAETALLACLSRHGEVPHAELVDASYTLHDGEAALHLLRVSAGLDAMVLGEEQIQGQVRRTYEQCRQSGRAGPLLNRLFAAALQAGKRVRSETAIGRQRASVPALAVEALGELSASTVAVLGAGEMSGLAVELLTERGAKTVIVASRGRERAEALASRFDCRTVELEQLWRTLAEVDAVIAASASPGSLLSESELRAVMSARSGRPLILIDLAVPRDIDPLCAGIPDVTLYDLEGLNHAAQLGPAVGLTALRQAEGILEEEHARLLEWLNAGEAIATIAAVRRYSDQVMQSVLASNGGRWETERDRDRAEAMAKALVKRLLHRPTELMRQGDEHQTEGGARAVCARSSA